MCVHNAGLNVCVPNAGPEPLVVADVRDMGIQRCIEGKGVYVGKWVHVRL